MKRFTSIDLFCGCGGFSLGMQRAGFKCLAAIDSNAEAITVFKTNFSHVPQILEKDLTKFPPDELAKLLGTEHLDVIVGGPPCQGFSTLRQGKKGNHGERPGEDKRRHLYQEFLKYVQFFQPKVFVMENVLGMRSASGGEYFIRVQNEARTDGYGSTFYHADGAGNITALMDGTEDIVARYLYNPFGKLLGQWGSMANANEMQFSSMSHDNISGLSFYPFRAYEPNFQRWPNQDPIGENGGLNLYGYVGNNPINKVDPLGLQVLANPYNAEAFSPGSTFLSGNPGNVSAGQYLGLMGVGIGGAALAATGVGLTADAYGGSILAMLGLGGAAANTPEGQAELNEAEQALANAANVVKTCPVNPANLRLPPTRPDGADPFKLANLMRQFGNSIQGMPPNQVTLGANNQMMINDGVTRATLAAINGVNQVPATIIENNPSLNLNSLPTIGQVLSGK